MPLLQSKGLWELLSLIFNAFHLQLSKSGYQRACSKDSGYSSAFLKALGRDCSGLVNPAIERTHEMESELEHARLSDEYRRVTVDKVLQAVKDGRRKN
jgi:hypothetical protein